MSWFAEEAGCSPADIDRCALFTFTCEGMFAYRTQRVAVYTHHVPPHSYKQFICTSTSVHKHHTWPSSHQGIGRSNPR